MALPITIVSDIVCPWCFIGHKRLAQALALEQMLDTSDKMSARAEELQSRQAELHQTIKESQAKCSEVASLIEQAKTEFEAAVSKHFEGRRINLMGVINAI